MCDSAVNILWMLTCIYNLHGTFPLNLENVMVPFLKASSSVGIHSIMVMSGLSNDGSVHAFVDSWLRQFQFSAQWLLFGLLRSVDFCESLLPYRWIIVLINLYPMSFSFLALSHWCAFHIFWWAMPGLPSFGISGYPSFCHMFDSPNMFAMADADTRSCC